MRTRLVFALVGMLGCTSSGPISVDKAEPVTPTPPQATPPRATPPQTPPDTKPEALPESDAVARAITVEMTAATLADDCGGGPSSPPETTPAKASVAMPKPGNRLAGKSKSRVERRCEQSSIQLAIAAPVGAEPAKVAVKSVELFLDSGASVGKLEARAPSVWSDADGYMPWDQSIEPGKDLSVSYALTRPDWTKVKDRWNETYTVKAVLSIGGSDQTVQRSAVVAVEVAAPTSLPPGVKT